MLLTPLVKMLLTQRSGGDADRRRSCDSVISSVGGGATHTEIEQYETETLAVNSLKSEIMLKISD